MEQINNNHLVIDKISKGEPFGLFDDGDKCYFEDGSKVSYSAMWAALREIHHLPLAHHKTLTEICPDIFLGSFKYSYSKQNWKRAVAEKMLRSQESM